MQISDELAALDPTQADADGLASSAREQLLRQEGSERAATQRKAQIQRLQQRWQAVIAVSDELAALDPTAADPEGLATSAREHLQRQEG